MSGENAELRRLIEELRMEVHDRLAEREEPKAGPMQHAVVAAAVLQGIGHALEPVRSAIEAQRQAIERDAGTDTRMAEGLERLLPAVEKLTACTDHLTGCVDRLADILEVLASPRTRTARVMLPDGPAEMTITEAHELRRGH